MELENIKKILRAAFNVKPVEIGCDDCEEEMDKYATYDIQGKELDGHLSLIKEHLERCKSCDEEFQSLLVAFEVGQEK